MNNHSLWFEPFKAGDKQAFRLLFELHYQRVCYSALKILHVKEDAEDIVSDTFDRAWRQHTKFNTARHLINFLYRVTKNECIKKLRDDNVTEKTDEEWVRLTLGETTTGPAAEYERTLSRLMAIIVKELETLPGGEAIRMSFLQGMSTREIARALNTTENNVYIMKSRGLKALRSRPSLRDFWCIVGVCLATGVFTDELLQQAYLSSIEKNAIDLTGVPAAFLQSTGQAGDRHHRDRSLADAFPLATAKRLR